MFFLLQNAAHTFSENSQRVFWIDNESSHSWNIYISHHKQAFIWEKTTKKSGENGAGFFCKNNFLNPRKFSLARETDTIKSWAILQNLHLYKKTFCKIGVLVYFIILKNYLGHQCNCNPFSSILCLTMTKWYMKS